VISSGSSSSDSSAGYVYPASSPIKRHNYSDAVYSSQNGSMRKKLRFEPQFDAPSASASVRKVRASKRYSSHAMGPPSYSYHSSQASWKSTHNLAESSPLGQRLQPDFRTCHGPNISFMSTASTTVDDSPFQSDEENELPAHSFNNTTATALRAGSPPRTPPPTRSSRSLRNRKTGGEEGADLLLFLATSPSPAARNPVTTTANQPRLVPPPSTPPSNHANLPSSMLNTPGGGNLFGFSTPGQNFNFADFVNITPSPAQAAFGSRTPGGARTPLAAREARRRINFDSLVPPGGSPIMTRSSGRGEGLGMELGGELVS
jgi:hypothetical protein